jgi:glycosyltransferase involved in cell wall biosynthesis
MKIPKLSIITPFYNTPIPYFRNYFQSLLSQSFQNFEVLLINDCSTDDDVLSLANTVAIKDSRFKIINLSENKRTYLARCEGLKNVTGNYVTFLDSDDYITKDYYFELINLLESDKSLDFVEGRIRNFWVKQNFLEEIREYFTKEVVLNSRNFNIIDCVYKRALIDKSLEDIFKIKRKTYYGDDHLMGFFLQKNAIKINNLPNSKEYRCFLKTEETISSPQIMDYDKLKNFIEDCYLNFLNIKDLATKQIQLEFLSILEERIVSPYFSKLITEEQAKELSNFAREKIKEFSYLYKIPKTIHYIWLSNDEKPQNIQEFIDKNYKLNFFNNGGWDIKIWGMNDFPEEVKNNPWFISTIKNKNWASCSDYLRAWIIYNYGGFYFDSDIEVIKPIPKDWIHEKEIIFGYQYDGYLECGIFGAAPENIYIKKILDWYNKEFNPEWMIINKSNTLPEPLNSAKLKIYTAPNLWTNLLFNDIQKINPLPPDILSAKDYLNNEIKISDDTITIHHFSGSWLPKKEFNLDSFGFKKE